MSRGRIIRVASLPVLLLGASSFANEVDKTTPASGPAGVIAPADEAWAARWKAAAAESAARKLAAGKADKVGTANGADTDWAARWQAAADELKARKAARKAPPIRLPAPSAAPAKPAP